MINIFNNFILAQKKYLNEYLNLRFYFHLSILLIFLISITTLINTLFNYSVKDTVNLQYVAKLLLGGILGNVIIYFLKTILILLILLSIFNKKNKLKKIFGGLIICDIPILFTIIISIFIPSFFYKGINGLTCNITSLCYYLEKLIENKYILSLLAMVDLFEFWRLLLVSYLLNILGEVKIFPGFIIGFLINFLLLIIFA